VVALYDERWEVELSYNHIGYEVPDREEAIRGNSQMSVAQEFSWAALPSSLHSCPQPHCLGVRPMGKPSMHIVAIGGCHVSGFGVSHGESFVDHLARAFIAEGSAPTVELHPRFRLADSEQLSGILADRVPDIVLLQVGNYEAAFDWQRRVRKALGLSSRSDGTDAPLEYASDAVYLPRNVRGPSGLLRDVTYYALGKILFDPSQLAGQCDTLLSAVVRSGCKRVVVITPLPSMLPWIRRGRSRIGQVMVERAKAVGLPVLDSLPLLSSARWFLPDGSHLNRQGHLVLAEGVLSVLREKY
jgi:hypothetical protein